MTATSKRVQFYYLFSSGVIFYMLGPIKKHKFDINLK